MAGIFTGMIERKREEKRMAAAMPAIQKMMGQQGTQHILQNPQDGMPVDLSTQGTGVMGTRPENQGVNFARGLMNIEGFEKAGMALLPQAFQNRAQLFATMDHQEAQLNQNQSQFDAKQQQQASQWQEGYNLKSAEWEAQKIANTRKTLLDQTDQELKDESLQGKMIANEQAAMNLAKIPAEGVRQLEPLMQFDTDYARQAQTWKPEYAVNSQFMLLSDLELSQMAKHANSDAEREMVSWWRRESKISSAIFNQLSGAAVSPSEEDRLNKSMLLPTMNSKLISKLIRERYGANREAIDTWKVVFSPTFKRETPLFNPAVSFPDGASAPGGPPGTPDENGIVWEQPIRGGAGR